MLEEFTACNLVLNLIFFLYTITMKQNLTIMTLTILLAAITGGVAGNMLAHTLTTRQETLGLSTSTVEIPTPSPIPVVEKIAIPKITDKDYIRGNQDAETSIIIYQNFSSFSLPLHIAMQTLLEKNPQKMRWVYRHFSNSPAANGQKEAELAACVASLGGKGRYWQYIDKRVLLQDTADSLDKQSDIAVSLDINRKKINSCIKNATFAETTRQLVDEAKKAGILENPTIIVQANNKVTILKASQLGEIIDMISQALH